MLLLTLISGRNARQANARCPYSLRAGVCIIIAVIFGSLPKGRIGSCQPDSYPKVVTIDHYYWKIATVAAREQLRQERLTLQKTNCLVLTTANRDSRW